MISFRNHSPIPVKPAYQVVAKSVSWLLAGTHPGGQAAGEHITEVDIYPDDWCRIYHGGYCNCDPEVNLRPPPQGN